MRNPIQVDIAPVDLDSYQARIDKIRDLFALYLAHYRPKSSASKHGLMGPVGKILGETKSGRRDPQYLKGYVLRAHESSQRSAPPPDAIQALEEGIEALVQLLRDVPVTAHDKLIDRLDYGLYFQLRKKFIRWLQDRDDQYRSFLRAKYPELSLLNRAWTRDLPSWESVRYGGKSSGTYKKASAAQRQDMDDFAQRLKELGKEEVAESPEEEIA